MARVKPRFVHRVQYAAGRGLLALLGMVRFDTARAIGRSLARMALSPFGVRRNVVERQIAAAFPDARADEVKALVVEGSEENIKVTTPADLALVEAILTRKQAKSK